MAAGYAGHAITNEGGNKMRFLRKFFNSVNKKNISLGPLNSVERVAVSNLNPLIYQAVINEKKGEKSSSVILNDKHTMELLTKLSIFDLEFLCKSVKASIRGVKYEERKAITQAFKHYRRAFNLNPYNDVAIVNYGVLSAEQGNLRDGISYLERALKINPDNERARMSLATMKSEAELLQTRNNTIQQNSKKNLFDLLLSQVKPERHDKVKTHFKGFGDDEILAIYSGSYCDSVISEISKYAQERKSTIRVMVGKYKERGFIVYLRGSFLKKDNDFFLKKLNSCKQENDEVLMSQA